MRVQVSLDNAGCLAVIVLAVAIHWALVSHFGASGLGSGALVWGVAFVIGLTVVGRIYARDAAREERAAHAALAAAKCPWCGVVLGDAGAAQVRAASDRARFEAIRAGMGRGMRVNPRRGWFGACPACRRGIAFDARTRTIVADRDARDRDAT